MIEVRNRSVMNERGAQASDATIASGPLTERGTVTELRPSTLPVVRDGQNGADGLGRLVADWEEGRTPSDLSDYLPDPAKIRRAALIELVGIDMEYRWLKNDCPKRLTDYCAEYPELLEEPLPAELLYEEFRLRKQGGEDVAAAEYLSEFPLQAESFEQMFDRDSMAGREDVMMLGLSGFDEFEIGQHLDDFELVLELGHGAFARVFLARQLSMQRWVALKISRNVGVEPQTLAQLDHPNIVRVFDQRLLEERALRVLFMEYVPGGTLLDVVKLVRVTPQAQRSGQLLLDAIDKTLAKKGEMKPSETSLRSEIAAMSWPETVAWMGMRLADALEYAREHGVLHRDIKPANVLLSVEGIPKLADFNVSSSEEVSTEDAACFVGGSLAYMSPEQLEACAVGAPGTLDTRSDIYALGVMLWELLTGSRPFTDDGTGESPPSPKKALEARRRGVDPAAEARLPDDCPPALRRVLVKVVWRPKVGSSVRTVSGPVCSQSGGPTGRESTFDAVEVGAADSACRDRNSESSCGGLQLLLQQDADHLGSLAAGSAASRAGSSGHRGGCVLSRCRSDPVLVSACTHRASRTAQRSDVQRGGLEQSAYCDAERRTSRGRDRIRSVGSGRYRISGRIADCRRRNSAASLRAPDVVAGGVRRRRSRVSVLHPDVLLGSMSVSDLVVTRRVTKRRRTRYSLVGSEQHALPRSRGVGSTGGNRGAQFCRFGCR